MQVPILSNDIDMLRTADEGQFFDRKSSRIKPRDLAITLIAFANATGGKIAIGIENDGSVTGFNRDGAQNAEAFENLPIFECVPAPAVKHKRVPVTNHRGDSDFVLVLDVEPSTDAVIRRKCDGAVFLRQEDKSIELDDHQILALEYDKNQRTFEDEISPRATMEDVDHEVLDRYKNALSTTAPDEQVLRSRNFLVDGHLTNAGILLFAKSPTKFLPQARVRVLRFEGSEMKTGRQLNIVKDVTFDGPIPKAVDEASALIKSMLREFQYLGEDGRFETIPEYPEFAWFAGLVNAVTHRDYAFAGDHIRISMYDDRLEIKSPGKLPNIVTVDNMRETRYSRNPRIARTLVEFGWVRELNEGVKRIYSEMQRMFLKDPVWSEPSGASVQMVLENSITSRVLRTRDTMENALGQEALESLNENEMAAMRYVYARGQVSTKALAEYIGRSDKFARKTLRGLVSKNLLIWHGTSSKDSKQHYSLPYEAHSSEYFRVVPSSSE
jgi:ATP-dependent DNA helicase RecG